ncbi:MAG TPA: hypothetical protein VLA35_09195 [Thermoleophilia bacterium]|nr:hypothetical protein [Thermoleophilia bacterium]
MILNAETTVHDLLAGCPELRPHIEALLPHGDPDIGAAGVAKRHRLTTIADVARGANLTHHELLRDLHAEAARLGVAGRVAGAGASSLEEADDLEAFVEQLEQGRDLLEVAAVVRRVGVGAHRGVSGHGLATWRGPVASRPVSTAGPDASPGPHPGASCEAGGASETEPGHPLDTLRREIEAAEQVLRMLRSAVEAMEREPAEWARVRPLVFRLLDLLEGLERHYRRAVELVCPHLRRHGRGELGGLLFAAQGDVMRLLAEVRRDVDEGESEAATVACRRLLEAATESLRQEEYLLLPVAEATLGEEEWREVRRGEATIGWALIDAPPPWPARP